ncbi:putative gustatory receptor 28a [Ctenocephalides felis]|uniref:putative gustatory receptor 28a n=1 Tax=Ctenocephalides felis TaxID=7515 RepID=UPI000E6E30CF|nr:putative gustatory receptor 28a [Ctenocephalides felis]
MVVKIVPMPQAGSTKNKKAIIKMCFVRATLPLYYMFKIFGLSTIHIRKDEKTKKLKYVCTKNSTLEYIYCFVILALLQIACLADILLGSLEEDETLEVAQYYEAALECAVRILLEDNLKMAMIRLLAYEISDLAFIFTISFSANCMFLLRHRISCAIELLMAPPIENEGYVENIYKAMNIYNMTYKHAEIFEKTLVWPLVFGIGLIFQTIVMQGYNLYQQLYGAHIIAIIECLKWVVISYLQLLLVVRPAECIKREAAKCGSTLHSKAPQVAKTGEVNSQILLRSSLQLVHEPILFSAIGFFDIDYTLAYNMTGAALMYLVILMQFDHGRRT